MADNLPINLIKSNNCLGVEFFTGTIKFKDLADKYQIPVYRAGTSITDSYSGYQREAADSRISAVSDRVSKAEQVSQPFVDNVNLNIRFSSALAYVEPLDPKKNDYGDFFILKYTNALGKFFVVDGQTRLRGASDALQKAKLTNNQEQIEAINNITVQFTLSFCDDVYKEAYLFYLINHHSKKIPPEGAITLIKQGYEASKIDFTNEITDQSKKTDVFSYQIAERLNRDSSVWGGEMRDFNEKNTKKTTILAVSRMIAPLFIELTEKHQEQDETKAQDATFKIVEAYWSALELVFPMLFRRETKDQYNVLKAGPAEVMTKVLTAIIKMNEKESLGLNLTDPKSYQSLLTKLREFSDVNAFNNTVKGSAIFNVGKKGAIGKYSNNAGKTDMARRMYQHIFPQEKSVI